MGWTALLECLRMTPDWGSCSMCWKAGLLSKQDRVKKVADRSLTGFIKQRPVQNWASVVKMSYHPQLRSFASLETSPVVTECGQPARSRSGEKALGSWCDTTWPGGRSAPMQQSSLHTQSCTSRRKGSFPDAQHWWDHSWCSPQVWAPRRGQTLTYRNDPSGGSLWWLELEHNAYEGRWRGMGWFSLEKRRERGDLTAVATAWWEGREKRNPGSAWRCTATGWEVTGMCWNVGNPH